jgi:hypothetical protein
MRGKVKPADPAAVLSIARDLSELDRLELILGRIRKLNQEAEALAREQANARVASNRISNTLEYNDVARQGHAGSTEALILAKKLIDDPAYEEKLREERRRYQEVIDPQRVEVTQQLLAQYVSALETVLESRR